MMIAPLGRTLSTETAATSFDKSENMSQVVSHRADLLDIFGVFALITVTSLFCIKYPLFLYLRGSRSSIDN